MQLGRYCGTLHRSVNAAPDRERDSTRRKHVMWQRLSLRGRINLLLALMLTLGLGVNVARLVLEAAPRVQAEDQSVTRLAREFVETIVAGLQESADPEARLDQMILDLRRLRHVRI